MRSAILVLILYAIPILSFSATIEVPKDYTTIQAAIDAAVNGDKVLVAPGTYVENINFKGKAIIVISSAGAVVTIIDGESQANPYESVVTFNSGEDANSVLEGFTIENGNGTNVPPYGWRGGGIYCLNSSPSIIGNKIQYNYSEFHGGGIYCENSSINISSNHIHSNTSGEGGGGIYSLYSSPVISNNIIEYNTSGTGGGIHCAKNTCDITNNIIRYNIVNVEHLYEGGAGIYCWNITGSITSNNISNNKASGSIGLSYGGGILYSKSSLTIINNIICGNYSGNGGGIAGKVLSTETITNNIISNNTALKKGGGFFFNNTTPVISNNTICFNHSDTSGGGIHCHDYTSALITNSIFWNNYSPIGIEISVGQQFGGPSKLTISHSDVRGGKSSVFVDPQCTLYWNSGMIDKDPLFTAGLKGSSYLSQITAGQPLDSPCVDTGSDFASNLGMDIYWTRTDEVTDSGMIDLGFHYGGFTFPTPPSLQSDTYHISASTGGVANFFLLGATVNANRKYLILGSMSGTSPGTKLIGGKLILPINFDKFTNIVFRMMHTPFFFNFIGTLDSNGTAKALFSSLGPLPIDLVGYSLYYAYALNKPWNFASNPVEILIVP